MKKQNGVRNIAKMMQIITEKVALIGNNIADKPDMTVGLKVQITRAQEITIEIVESDANIDIIKETMETLAEVEDIEVEVNQLVIVRMIIGTDIRIKGIVEKEITSKDAEMNGIIQSEKVIDQQEIIRVNTPISTVENLIDHQLSPHKRATFTCHPSKSDNFRSR